MTRKKLNEKCVKTYQQVKNKLEEKNLKIWTLDLNEIIGNLKLSIKSRNDFQEIPLSRFKFKACRDYSAGQ